MCSWCLTNSWKNVELELLPKSSMSTIFTFGCYALSYYSIGCSFGKQLLRKSFCMKELDFVESGLSIVSNSYTSIVEFASPFFFKSHTSISALMICSPLNTVIVS
jgi:hypothetical protein